MRQQLLEGSNAAVGRGGESYLASVKQGERLKGQKRIIDRFIKYPYPSNIITQYKKEYRQKEGDMKAGNFTKEQAFNLEKEHKIINPHNMDMHTTARVDFKPFAVVPQKKELKVELKQPVPFQKSSQYGNEYPNW
eukprot:CAMPEP_0202964028 /NCGR_PEP_ID=MMETSP1396-20130829/8087_1 /ASSEMBLY_ACC=CAM_ASM_000872 /TAXON_ID= /ORGANISM="Pseudokeronopsis sp., Strain Brazil" /LENGTH=134 /DNA_ID=CAMNT_0049685783 /DNA_START=492 /DNA_END=893 /DNA_ORIENTATION=+